jgi:GT2 family glycosyltransferase
LAECVQSVLEGDEVPTEVIIVDQSDVPHQTLPTLKTDRACEIRYLWVQGKGVGRARNAAIAAAQYDVTLLIDDDVLVTATWFNALVRALMNAGQRSVVTGRVLSTEAEVFCGFAPSTKTEEIPAVYAGRIGKDVLFTGNMALYRSTLDEIGPFDERLGVGGRFSAAYDNDFGFRLLEARYRIIYVPEALLYHRAWRSERNYLRLRWNYGRGQGAFLAKHLSLRDRFMLWRMVRSIKDDLLGVVWCLRRQRHLAYGNLIYVLAFLSGAIEWLITQRKRE